ncbi:MAG: hypothetical protein H6881_09755 [Rhodobiaceae bacterium]|nr:hypothetical protein [Rhodobiaceae bacterium]
MADMESGGIATDASAADDPFADLRAAKPWLDAVFDAEKTMRDWQEKSDSIDKLYADLKRLSATSQEREMQLFWANLEVLKPSIYARPPVPVVQGRFKNQQQGKELVRHASEVLERSLISSFDMEDLHESLKGVRDDLSTNSRGQLWLRLEEKEDGSSQRVCYDHLCRQDFIHEPARKWKEIGWVGKKVYLTQRKFKARFPDVDLTKVEFTERKKDDQDAYAKEKTACVIEIWSKTENCVVWVTGGVDTVLDIREPFLQLEKFFPCPRPAYGTLQRDSLIPVPDFVYYKDQIEEINELTARISALAEALRVKGFYSAGAEDVASAIEAAIRKMDNNAILIPVSSVAALGGQGMKDAIVWMPIDQIASVIKTLVELRRQMIDDVYQITGLSDIMRGSTDPNETLGAQQLKSQYGSVRIRDRQEEMVRIARDAARIAAEIMAENFSPETLMMYSQYQGAPSQVEIRQQIMQIDQQIAQARANPDIMAQAQENPEMAQQMLAQADEQKRQLTGTVTIEQVFEFLRDQRLRPFVLDIETDSTIQADEDAAKQRTTEFLTAMGTALAQLAPMVAQQPQSAEFAGEVLKFAVSPFRAGRQLEAAIDDFVEQMKSVAQQPQPNPEAERAQVEAEMKQAEMQMKMQEAQARMAEMQANAATAQEQARADLQKTMAEIEKINAEIRRIQSQASAAVVTAKAKAAQPKPIQGA